MVLYGVLKGSREPIKKSILQKCNLLSTLFVYTVIGFLMSISGAKGALNIPPAVFVLILLKSASIFVAWTLSFVAIKKVPVSIYGVTDMSRVIFSTLMGVFFLHESLTIKGIISLILIVTGLYFANRKEGAQNEEYSMKYIWLLILSCALNGVSGTLDKYIMSMGVISSGILQFWFMFTLSILYFVYIKIKGERLMIKECLKNPWIYVLSASLVFGDRLLFIANSNPNSKVTIMTLIKQSSAVVTIILGKFIYKEKNILKKLVCASVVIIGIMIAVL